MPEYIIENRKVFDTEYLKVELRNNSHLESVQYLLSQLQSVKRVNITGNKRTDMTVYPSKFFSITETKQELIIQLDNYYERKPLDPIFIKDKLSTISDKAYHQIIEEINTFGRNLEKYQALYSKFDEEGFRDFFLPHLNTISRNHSATGETFNKKGKTDILIQDQFGTNIFIAECKIWYGEIEFLTAISQLIERYVCWRDEKIALIIFNKINKKFSELIESAKSTITKHTLFVKMIKENDPTSISYEFRSEEDENKLIQLELIIFNCS